ncbi:hypothetical protein V8E55_009351, partial [Tylopilus felleus]
PLGVYFAGFASSTYQPNTTAQKNFECLCSVCLARVDNSPACVDARQGFEDTLVQQFNFLAARHNLCKTIGIDSIDECDIMNHLRLVVWEAHVHIVDLIKAVRRGRPVRQFNTLDELAAHTKKKVRFFPKENAYQGGLPKGLLREIINP